MACSITITSVIGIPAAPNSTITSAIRVTGTQTGDCQPAPSGLVEIIVQAICQGTANKGIATPDSLGNWAVDIPLRCTCSELIIVTASCATDPACMDTFKSEALQCGEGNCPTGSLEVSPGDCNSDGTRNVTLTAHITSVPTGTIVGQWIFQSTVFGPAVTPVVAGQNYSISHSYAPPGPGPQDPVQFSWVLPANCPPLTAVVSGLQTCPIVCPTNVNVQVTASQPSACTPTNTRSVTFNALVTGVTTQASWEWDIPGGTTQQQTTGLGLPPQSITVEYPAATANTPTASCTVRIFNGVCEYTGSKTVDIPACGGGGGGGNGGSGLCAGLLISAITLLVLGAMSIIIGVCFNVLPLVIAGGIAAGLGLLLFILWVVLCARFTSCSVMQTMHCILFFLIAVIAPIIFVLAILFGGLPCAIAVATAWGGWGTVYAWLGVVMGQVNCPKTC
jgi:hypothetical protein